MSVSASAAPAAGDAPTETPLNVVVEQILNAVLAGAPTEQLIASLKALLQRGTLAPSDSVALFKVLPRRVTYPFLLSHFFAAEEASGSTDVSSLLMSSSFAGCEPRNDAFIEAVSIAVERVPSDPSFQAEVLKWRVFVGSSKSKSAEAHAVQAIVCAINQAAYSEFESTFNALQAACKPTKPDSVLLFSFFGDILVHAAGMKAFEEFTAKNKGFLERVGIVDAARHVRIVSLVHFLLDKADTTYDALLGLLRFTSDLELEALLVEASSAHVVDVTVNKSARTVSVHCAVPLVFDKGAWQRLRDNAASMQAFVDGLLQAYDAK